MARIIIRSKYRRGIIAVFVSTCMIVILSMVAITLDGGSMLDRRRHAQATADAAAMAAACEIYTAYPSAGGLDPSGKAAAAAKRVAGINGFSDDSVTSSVTVNIPPVTGPYTGKPGYVEINVTYQQTVYFGRIFGTDKRPVKARAVARGGWVAFDAGVLVLDYTGKNALNAQGNAAFTQAGGPVIVNSNNPSAVTASGNGKLLATAFYITGEATISGANAWIRTEPVPDQIFEGVHPTPDPFAYIPSPAMPENGTMTTTSLGGGKKLYTLTPGRYTNLPTFTSGDQVILKQASAGGNGLYFIDGGGFKSTGANISMDPTTSGGVLIYNKPAGNTQSQKVQITGNSSGSVNLSGLTSGPYTGLLLWQDRNTSVDMLVEGNGLFTVNGAIYAPGALLNVNGNGGHSASDSGESLNGATIGSQYIVKDLSLGGNGNVYLNYRGNGGRARMLTLVE